VSVDLLTSLRGLASCESSRHTNASTVRMDRQSSSTEFGLLDLDLRGTKIQPGFLPRLTGLRIEFAIELTGALHVTDFLCSKALI
jgi:hypothetical protein